MQFCDVYTFNYVFMKGNQLTPSNKYEAPEVFRIRPKGHENQAVQVETFYQDPVIVGGKKIDEEDHRHLAANLLTEKLHHHLLLHVVFSGSFQHWID